jgi:hypothetical protein
MLARNPFTLNFDLRRPDYVRQGMEALLRRMNEDGFVLISGVFSALETQALLSD